MDFKKTVAAASNNPTKALEWISKIENVENMEELDDPGEFGSLDAKIMTGLYDKCTIEFRREISTMMAQLNAEDKVRRNELISCGAA